MELENAIVSFLRFFGINGNGRKPSCLCLQKSAPEKVAENGRWSVMLFFAEKIGTK